MKDGIRDLLAEIEDVSKDEFEKRIKPAIYEQLDKSESSSYLSSYLI